MIRAPRHTRRTRTTATLAAAVLFATALPATAQETTATITVEGGALSITTPADAGNLGIHTTVLQGTVSGTLGEVQVNDARNAPADSGWVASAISTDFTPSSGPNIPASAVGYTTGPITKVGTATHTANDPTDLTQAVPAVTATEITGNNSATWNPTISVTVPAGTVAGVYSATITHSVL